MAASKRERVKREILMALKRSQDGELYLDELSPLCREAETRMTLLRYLNEMERVDHTITRIRGHDLQDKRRVLVKLNSQIATPALLTLEALEAIRKISQSHGAPNWKEQATLEADRAELSKTDRRAYAIQLGRLLDIFAVTYGLICEHHGFKPGETYLRVQEETVRIKPRTLRSQNPPAWVSAADLNELWQGKRVRTLGMLFQKDLDKSEQARATLIHVLRRVQEDPALKTTLEAALPEIKHVRIEELL